MKSCVSVHNTKVLNKEVSVNFDIQEIKEIINDVKRIIEKLEVAIEKLEDNSEKNTGKNSKKEFTVEDIENMSNKEIQELFNNHICYVEYRKKNGDLRVFEEFTFQPEYRKKITKKSNFDYEEELKNFVFGIELETGEYKRLLPQNIIYIKVLD